MKKILNIILFLSICALVWPQSDDEIPPRSPPPLPDSVSRSEQISTFAAIEDSESSSQELECTIRFHSGGRPVYTEFLDPTEPYAQRSSFSAGRNNAIDKISWGGSLCFCWVVIYQETNYLGYNLNLFTKNPDGSGQEGVWDLRNMGIYNDVLDDWEFWSNIISSYVIYCVGIY